MNENKPVPPAQSARVEIWMPRAKTRSPYFLIVLSLLVLLVLWQSIRTLRKWSDEQVALDRHIRSPAAIERDEPEQLEPVELLRRVAAIKDAQNNFKLPTGYTLSVAYSALEREAKNRAIELKDGGANYKGLAGFSDYYAIVWPIYYRQMDGPWFILHTRWRIDRKKQLVEALSEDALWFLKPELLFAPDSPMLKIDPQKEKPL